MQDWYHLPKDSTAYPLKQYNNTIEYHRTPEFKRWFAKRFFSAYLLLAIIIPLLWMFVFGITNILDAISILCIQIVCIAELLYVLAYSIDEIGEFLRKKFKKEIRKNENTRMV